MKLPDCPVADEDEELLLRCRGFLSLLSSSASSVVAFRGRWSAIAATAGRLSASLDDLSGLAGTTPLAADLLRSLSQTLDLTLALANACLSADPPAGKLRTQSDLAAASAALDQLAADADLLIRSGAPAAAAGGLVIGLQVGSSASRIAALDALIAFVAEDDRNAAIAAEEGAVRAIVRLLDSASGGGVREKASVALARFSCVPNCRDALAAEGAAILGHLARVLESDGGTAREKACAALQTITLARDAAIVIGSRGGIAALLEICRGGSPSAQAAAAGVLKNLAAFQELRQSFIDEDGIPVLIGVLASGTALAQENAIGCLCSLASGEDEQGLIKITIFKEGALDYLKNYLENGRGEDRNLEPAIGLLRNLASFRYIAEIIVSASFLPHIIAAFGSNKSSLRTEAAKAITELVVVGKARKEIGETIVPLVRMLEARTPEEKESAVKALASLVSFSFYRKIFHKDEKGIVNVVQLLDPLVRNVNKKYPISVLLSLSQSRRCRKQMVAVGACGFLQGLLVAEVEGAKRLLESLGRGKILGVFPRA
ncbi:uncharacterized protein [Typha angustifolia]|uniref:uncharacterized protein n=1 Tax=Typha angustifolia TaxID=59011 RepID=UPI003C2DB1FD